MNSINEKVAAEAKLRQQQKDYKICLNAVSILGEMCAATPDMIIDKLTGCLWDEQEASRIKAIGKTQ